MCMQKSAYVSILDYLCTQIIVSAWPRMEVSCMFAIRVFHPSQRHFAVIRFPFVSEADCSSIINCLAEVCTYILFSHLLPGFELKSNTKVERLW